MQPGLAIEVLPVSANRGMGALEPSRRLWRNWQRLEPSLQQLTYRRLRATLSDQCQRMERRRDELLAALVRLAQDGDHLAGAVVIDCLQPGVRKRAARYRMGLSPDEARAELNVGLWEAIVTIDTKAPRHVASRLLERATDRLRRKARANLDRRSRFLNDSDGHLAQQPDDGGDLADLVALLVTVAKVVPPIDVALVVAVDVRGELIRDAAHQLGLGYEAARKRRQRTHRHLARCWAIDTQSRDASGRASGVCPHAACGAVGQVRGHRDGFLLHFNVPPRGWDR